MDQDLVLTHSHHIRKPRAICNQENVPVTSTALSLYETWTGSAGGCRAAQNCAQSDDVVETSTTHRGADQVRSLAKKGEER